MFVERKYQSDSILLILFFLFTAHIIEVRLPILPTPYWLQTCKPCLTLFGMESMIVKEMFSHFKNQLLKTGVASTWKWDTCLQRSLLSKSTMKVLGIRHFLQGDGISSCLFQVVYFSFYSEQCRTSLLRLHVWWTIILWERKSNTQYVLLEKLSIISGMAATLTLILMPHNVLYCCLAIEYLC